MRELWPVHTVVFDLDDTLYPEREFVASGFLAVDAWLLANHGFGGFAAEAQRLFDAGHRGHIFDEVLDHLRAPLAPTLVPSMVQVYRTHRPTLRLFPDADEALSWATGVGLRMALVTDGFAAVQHSKIQALGLHERIPCCIVTDELGGRDFWKPHAEAFSRVMMRHPGSASGYVYVGDNPRKDFIGPRRLGWRTLRVRRPGGEHASDEGSAETSAEREVVTLARLEKLLAAPTPESHGCQD